MAAETTYDTETELHAVNSILAAIGQAPVSRIWNTEDKKLSFVNPEVSFAYQLLQEVNVDVQNEGWVFNREDYYELSPDSEGYIKLPQNFLRMDVSDGQIFRTTDVIRRDGKLYDRMHHTFKFKGKLCFDIVWKFPFEDLPSVFKRYITMRAAGRAATQMVANSELTQLLSSQEAQLRAACMEYESNQGDYNFMGFPPGSAYGTYQPAQTLERGHSSGAYGYGIWGSKYHRRGRY
jgi:hypothetical protein